MNSSTYPTPTPSTGSVRRFIEAVVPAHVLDFWGSRLSSRWRWRQAAAVVVARRPASIDAVTLTLRPNRHWRGYVAGQHVDVGIEVDGRRITRSYSPSPVPGRPRWIEITVRQVDGGRLSTHLNQVTRVGDVLDLGTPYGELGLAERGERPLVLLAAGSGITPMLALIRASAAGSAPVTLHYWAARRAELCHVDELRALAATQPWFQVCFHLTREAAEATDERAGRIRAASFDGGHGDFAGRLVYACGPHGFVAAARAIAGAEAAVFRAESFSPLPPTAPDAGAAVAVRLARSGRTVSVPSGQPLLAALESLGLALPSGCRRGICNTCACGKRDGVSRDLATGTTTDEPLSALRLCVSAAASDLVLEL